MPKYRFQIVELGMDPLDAGIVELPDAATAMQRAKELCRNLTVTVQGDDGLDGASDYKGEGWNNFPDDSLIQKEEDLHCPADCPHVSKEEPHCSKFKVDLVPGTTNEHPTDFRCEACLLDAQTIEEKVGSYVGSGGVVCLYCGSTQIESEQVDADGGSGTANVRCGNCGKEWKDIWSLTGVLTLDDKGLTDQEIVPERS